MRVTENWTKPKPKRLETWMVGNMVNIKNNGSKIKIAWLSCESCDSGDASVASEVSNRSTETVKMRCCCFWYWKKKIQVIVLPLRWNAGRLEPHSTHYLPLKCSLACFQIQQGCKKEKTWTRMLTFSFCLNSQRNVGIKVTRYTARHKKKFYLLYRGPTEVVAKSYSNRYMNWRSPFKGLNRLGK